jgi:hypothetical protein
MAKGVVFSPQDGLRIAATVRRVEGLPTQINASNPSARSRWTADVQRAIYAVEYHDFYQLRKWDGVDANRTTGEIIYAWKPALLRPVAVQLYGWTITIVSVDEIVTVNSTKTEALKIQPAIRLDYSDTLISDAQPIDSALCSGQLSADLSTAGITIDQIVYQDLNILGRVFLPTQPAMFPVKVEEDGGANGTDTTAATYTYTVRTLPWNGTSGGEVLGTTVPVSRPREIGYVITQAGSTGYGVAFYDGTTLRLWDAGEIYGTEECPEPE